VFHGFFAALALAAVVVRRPRAHEAIALLACAAFAAYVTVLFATLR
jgi:hypothetical protein